VLFKSVKSNDPRVDRIDSRPQPYYGKYNYKATLTIQGAGIMYFYKKSTDLDVVSLPKWTSRRFKNANYAAVKQFLEWKENVLSSKKDIRVRAEDSHVSVFSSDIDFLRTLDTLGLPVVYYAVDEQVVHGVKFFKTEPKHKFRMYLKSKRVGPDFAKSLCDMVDRYKGTPSALHPSGATKRWLHYREVHRSWYSNYCSSGYNFDYDDEGVVSLFSLMFPGMISRILRLEKRPEET